MLASIRKMCRIATVLFWIWLTNAAPYNDTKAREVMVFASAAYCPKGRVDSWKMNRECAARTSQFETVTSMSATPPDVSTTRQFFGFMGIDHERMWIIASFKG
jgi:hypothetical protein